jgi:hypothetical protein
LGIKKFAIFKLFYLLNFSTCFCGYYLTNFGLILYTILLLYYITIYIIKELVLYIIKVIFWHSAKFKMKLIFPTFDILKFDAFTASLRFDLWLWEGVRMLNFTITTSHFFQNIKIGFLVHHYYYIRTLKVSF